MSILTAEMNSHAEDKGCTGDKYNLVDSLNLSMFPIMPPKDESDYNVELENNMYT